jgi:hypothetical protein
MVAEPSGSTVAGLTSQRTTGGFDLSSGAPCCGRTEVAPALSKHAAHSLMWRLFWRSFIDTSQFAAGGDHFLPSSIYILL